MKVRGGVVRRLIIVGLFLGLSVGACSSSSQQQQQETVEGQGSQGASQEGATDQASSGSGENQANGGDVSPGNGTNGVENGADPGIASNGAQAESEGSQDDSLTGLMNDMNSSIGQSTNPPAESMPESASGDMDASQPADPTADTMAPVADAGLPEEPAAAKSDSASSQATQPVAEATSAELPEMGAKLAYIIEKGDTLAKISQKIYGKGSLWQQLAKASRISNPNKIYPGELVYYQLTKETLAFATVYESMTKSTVTVAEGDTLAKISKKIYGTTENWRSIWRQNDFVNDPEVLTSGSVIYYLNHTNLVSQVKALRLKIEAEKKNSEHSFGFEKSISNSQDLNKVEVKNSINIDSHLGRTSTLNG